MRQERGIIMSERYHQSKKILDGSLKTIPLGMQNVSQSKIQHNDITLLHKLVGI